MTTQLPSQRVHLIGIGGAGMSVIAHLLLRQGAVVSGSDAAASSTVSELREAGASISAGHDGSSLPHQDAVVVISSAIRDDNPELVMARTRGLRIAHRAEALAWLMDGYRAICVAGTAGKTSTTSMLAAALQGAGLDPSYAVGGQLRSSGSGAHLGSGDVFVAEADESDSSFLRYSPTVAVVTNLEPDHLDHYGTAEAYTAAFDAFAARVVPGGTLIVCADDPGAQALGVRAAKNGVRVLQYGRAASGFDDARLLEFSSQGGAGRLRFSFRGAELELQLQVPGEHMAQNALAAFLAGQCAGATVEGMLEGLAGYDGVRRRFELKGSAAGVQVYDDYAHHPSKVSAQLRAARQVVSDDGAGGRLIVAFQPHLYSRTRDFAASFGAALSLADEVVILAVYGAREAPMPGVSSQLIVDEISLSSEHVHYMPERAEVAHRVAGLARSGDVVITMGAGDITALGNDILEVLQRRQKDVDNSISRHP